MLTARHQNMRDAHLSGLTTNQTSTYDKPTVRQLKIAFQETPLKLREIEDGWRGKRQQQLEEAKCTRGSSRQPSKSSTTRSKGGVRNVEAAVDRQSYLPSPPPSPSEPRRQSSQAPHPPPSTLEPSIFNTSQPRPILAFPLTPTVWPRNVAVGVSLHVPETASTPRCELHLNLGHQRVVVGSGGRCLIWTSEMNTRQSSKRIELDNAEKWSDVTRKRWELVHDLVEQVKRKTPRVSSLITEGSSSRVRRSRYSIPWERSPRHARQYRISSSHSKSIPHLDHLPEHRRAACKTLACGLSTLRQQARFGFTPHCSGIKNYGPRFAHGASLHSALRRDRSAAVSRCRARRRLPATCLDL